MLEKVISSKLTEHTYCMNCGEVKTCARLVIRLCEAQIFLCGSCIFDLAAPLKHADADKPLSSDEMSQLDKQIQSKNAENSSTKESLQN
jgi:hypothetical protein